MRAEMRFLKTLDVNTHKSRRDRFLVFRSLACKTAQFGGEKLRVYIPEAGRSVTV
jgi:hypothetical protein